MLTLEALDIRHDDWRLTADFALQAGSSTALVGPSGAGKSTLLNAIAGFATPVSGRILWEGRDLTGLRPGARPVTLLFQEHNLFAHLDAARNVGLGLRPDLKLKREDWERVEAALNEVGLAGFGARRPGQLSGGQRQRVALARALLRDRPILMLDEPFAALGPALKAEMLDLVARIRDEQAATLLMVTHAPADARRIASQVVLVEGGRARHPVATAALLDNPTPELAAYLGQT